MKNILISPKIISDKYGQLGHFLDLSWKDFFKNRANIFTTITNNTKFLNNIKIDGIIFSGGNNLHLLEKKKKI
ncbi:hypothetical protein ACIJYF_00725 [Candidatus Pelagibacter bacterium nBUS_49]|uniref:hypothetical protein n=1 Tax=Candidatus Pelagibacter bacterium nBUS_49 TaxID=3374196 RepID=UPI003EBA4108